MSDTNTNPSPAPQPAAPAAPELTKKQVWTTIGIGLLLTTVGAALGYGTATYRHGKAAHNNNNNLLGNNAGSSGNMT